MKQRISQMAYSILAGCIMLTAPAWPAMAAEAPPVPAIEYCPRGMALIPAGEFLKGWDNGEPDERPEVVQFTGPFCIDAYEYPNKTGDMPSADVSYDQAAQLCAAQNKRICTEPEWERACRGPRGLIYTNTQDYKQIQCNLNTPGAQAIGANPECGNAYGVFDMTGNLWEWVDGVYSEENPWPLIKGGSFKKGALFASCYARFTQPTEAQSDSVGFRCCADAEQAQSPTYGDACGANPGPFIHDDILALKQDSNVAFILFVDPFLIATGSPPSFSHHAPRAIVMRHDGTASLLNNANKGKEQWTRTAIEFDTAKPIADSFIKWASHTVNPELANNFWSCTGTRIYVLDGNKEYWVNIGEKIVSQPYFELLDIADKILSLPTE